MRQRELLELVAADLKGFNGHDYLITYAPLKNLSEQPHPEIFRFVKPQDFRKEPFTRGSLKTVQEVVIGHVGVIQGDSDQPIIDNQNEMDDILKRYVLGGGPIEGAIVKGNQSGPLFGSPVDGEGLEQQVRILVASVLLTFWS